MTLNPTLRKLALPAHIIFSVGWLGARNAAINVATAPVPQHGPGKLAGPAPIVIHAAGGIAVLAAITGLSVFKPWGLAAHGRRTRTARRSGTP